MAQVIHKDAANLVCVLLDVHIWSGRRHLEKTDLVHSNPEFRKLPEKDLANLGSVKICDPDDIRRFHTIKGQAERVLRRAGLPILGAVGVPADRPPNTQALIHVVEIHPVGTRDRLRSVTADRDERAVQKGELMREVADEATSLITDYLAGNGRSGAAGRREYVTQKTIGPLKRAAAKLTSFRFLDSTIGPLADMIQDVLASLPPSGRIDGLGLLKVWSLARMLSTPRQAAEMAQMAQQGAAADDLLGASGAPAGSDASALHHWEGGSIEGGQLQAMHPVAVAVAVAPSPDIAVKDLSLLL